MLLAFAAGLALVACAMGVRQVRTYREAARQPDGKRDRDASDLFSYSGRRLAIRLGGVIALLAIAATLAAWELGAAQSAAGAQSLVTALLVELGFVVLVALLDLRETARRSR